MGELPDRDLPLLLDMLLASRDALDFTQGLSKESSLAHTLRPYLQLGPEISSFASVSTKARARSGSANSASFPWIASKNPFPPSSRTILRA
ncbi:MAG: hypothetical protein R6U12_06725, partial [Thioalkalivibrio sp.]